MRIRILTTFPEMIEPIVHSSILGRAMDAGLMDIQAVDIRPYSTLKHKNTDDYPFGGGAGMVMLPQPICDAVDDIAKDFTGRRFYMSPRGVTFNQHIAEQLAKEDDLIILCGHYEGVDQRALDICGFEERSVGDYVLTGGELAAMVSWTRWRGWCPACWAARNRRWTRASRPVCWNTRNTRARASIADARCPRCC